MKRKEAEFRNLTPQTVERLEPSCGVFVDLCALKLWAPHGDGKFELLGDADRRVVSALLEPLIGKSPDSPELLAFQDAAHRIGLRPKTLYEWKRKGKLRRENGFRKLGGSNRIEWKIFKAAYEKGELS